MPVITVTTGHVIVWVRGEPFNICVEGCGIRGHMTIMYGYGIGKVKTNNYCECQQRI